MVSEEKYQKIKQAQIEGVARAEQSKSAWTGRYYFFVFLVFAGFSGLSAVAFLQYQQLQEIKRHLLSPALMEEVQLNSMVLSEVSKKVESVKKIVATNEKKDSGLTNREELKRLSESIDSLVIEVEGLTKKIDGLELMLMEKEQSEAQELTISKEATPESLGKSVEPPPVEASLPEPKIKSPVIAPAVFTEDEKWLLEQSDNNVTIQLMSARSMEDMRKALDRKGIKGYKIVKDKRTQKQVFVAFAGSFEDAVEAKKRMSSLKSMTGITGWVRPIVILKKILVSKK